jgi:hypothetical protein
MYLKKIIQNCALFLFLLTINNHQVSNSHSIEIYQDNNQIYNTISKFNILLVSTLKKIYHIYDIIINIESNSFNFSSYINRLSEKIILLKNENIPIDKKIIKLIQLIKENIPNKKDQEFILKVYKKILSIFL